MPPAPIQSASDAADPPPPDAVPVVSAPALASLPAVAQTGGFAEPVAGVKPDGASHVKAYWSDTVWPSAETICHSTVYLPEAPSAAFVVIDGPSTSRQPSS